MTRGRVAFYLPIYPPSVNNLFDNNRRGGRSKSRDYRAWCRSLDAFINIQPGVAGRPDRVTVPGNVAVTYQVKRPDRRRRDLDNLLKALNDALVRNFVIGDDAEIVALSIRWATDFSLWPKDAVVLVDVCSQAVL